MVDTPKEIRKIQNVIGVIEGEIEPGKVIIKIFIFAFIFKIFTFLIEIVLLFFSSWELEF